MEHQGEVLTTSQSDGLNLFGLPSQGKLSCSNLNMEGRDARTIANYLHGWGQSLPHHDMLLKILGLMKLGLFVSEPCCRPAPDEYFESHDD